MFGVTEAELMKCVDVLEPMKKLHATMGGTEAFSESAVSTDLADIARHMAAELPVSLRVKETNRVGSDIFRFNHSSFLILSSRTY